MFDVSWEDPESETVAQHRERKERDERSSLQGSPGSSMRSDESNDSSKSQNTQMPVKSAQAGSSKAPISKRGISLLKNTRLPMTRKKGSPITTGTGSESQQTITGARRSDSIDYGYHMRNSIADTIHSVPFSNGRSNVTGSSWSSVTSNTTKSYEVQKLAEDSFITRSTEVTVSPQDPENVLNEPMTEISICAEPLSPDDYTIEAESDVFQFPRVPDGDIINETTSITSTRRKSEGTISPMSEKPAELWKPPVDWGCPSDDANDSYIEGRASKRKPRQLSQDDPVTSSTGQTHLQRHILRMDAATPKIMLERIREEWAEVDDATIYKELEFEKHLWMLTALKYLNKRSGKGSSNAGRQEESILAKSGSSGVSKVLSLYENQAAASYLASFTTATEIHHISESPIPPFSIPDVYPLTVPSPQQHLPFAPLLFSSISSISLPTVLPISYIPTLLRECHRILVPSGTLCLTIIDPSPVLTTIGPRLRTWLDKHLLLNLEKHFRCMNPGRLLPTWLKEAGFSLKCKGAKHTIIRFSATLKADGNAAELGTEVGRMLWKEMWGGFAEGKKWWWDDEAVMDECAKLETRWECALIEAVKII